jgi:hypothetical protein
VGKTGQHAAFGVGFLEHLRQAFARGSAVGAVEDHLMDCGGRAGRY